MLAYDLRVGLSEVSCQRQCCYLMQGGQLCPVIFLASSSPESLPHSIAQGIVTVETHEEVDFHCYNKSVAVSDSCLIDGVTSPLVGTCKRNF